MASDVYKRMTERKRLILESVILEYIYTAEPVGSRTLARHYSLGFSPATIRNEMADLEEMNFLEQPYTSAGRIPSQAGYRYYVDYLMQATGIDPQAKMKVEDAYTAKMNEIDNLLAITSRLLCHLTNYTSLVLFPQINNNAFRQLQLIPVDRENCLMVVMTESGLIKHCLIPVPQTLSERELKAVVQYLNQQLVGKTMQQIDLGLIKKMRAELGRQIELLEMSLRLLADTFSESEQVVTGGAINILNQPEWRDVERIRQLFNFLEDQQSLVCLLKGYDGLKVRIGKENLYPEMEDCSLVMSAYRIKGEPVGAIGVIGPTRMDYSSVVSVVDYISNMLSHVLTFIDI